MIKNLIFKEYKDGDFLTKIKNTVPSDNKIFHFEIIEALQDCALKEDQYLLHLNKDDILVTEYFKHLNITSNNSGVCIRRISINLHYPTPLNQYLVGESPMIHDMMNDESNGLTYMIFQNLSIGFCHSYLDLLKKFALEADTNDEFVMFQAEKIAGLLFTELLRNHGAKISRSQSNFPSSKVKYANKYTQSGEILSYISDHGGNITLSEVATHFGYQKNYFSNLCKDLFGMNFLNLRLHIRMEIARNQLLLTKKNVEEISVELGYKDLSTFSKRFIDTYGISPSLYRENFSNYSNEV